MRSATQARFLCDQKMAGVLVVAVIFAWLRLSTGQQACTQAAGAYTSQAYTAYRSVGNSYSYDCGWWGWSTCYGTSYSSQAYTAYRSVLYYYSVCCSGYGGSGCIPICSSVCENSGTCIQPETCSCVTGWTGSLCTENIDECSLGTHTCDLNATCTDTAPSYVCSCDPGFTGNGMSCTDVDECAVDNGGCHHNCHNVIGSYTCSCNGSYELNVDGHTCEIPPPAPTNLQVLGIGDVSVNLMWQAPVIDYLNSLTEVSMYQMVAVQETFAISDVTIIIGTSGTSYTVDVLEEFTSYNLTVLAGNSFGFGPESNSVQFTTMQAAPSAPPESLSGVAVSPTEIIFTWSPPPPIDVNGVLLFYEIRLTEQETGQQWTLSSTEPQLNITALHPYYNYQCVVAAFTLSAGPYSNASQVQTLETRPTAPPLNVVAQAVNSTALTLTWEPPVFEEINGAIQEYSISMIEVDTSASFQFVSVATQLGISDLHPHYTYLFQVAAETVALGPYSATISVQLPQDAPASYPRNVSGYAVDSSSIALSWLAIPLPDQNGVVQYYSIEATETITGLVYVYNSSLEERIITGLHPYYIYECKVVAVTILSGPFSPPIIVQTAENAPSGPPLNLSVVAPTPWTLLFSWKPPPYEHHNGVLLGYTANVVTVTTGATSQLYSAADEITISVSIFKPFTVYTCSVAAFTEVGIGPFGSEISVQTPEYVPTEPLDTSVTRAIGLPTQLLVSWSPPTNANGIIISYTIYCREAVLGTEEEAGEESMSSAELESGSTVSLKPSGSGSGAFILPSGDGVDFSGSVDPGIIANYTIQTEVRGNESYVYVQQLVPFQEYECYVAASTSIGEGNQSSVVSAITDESTPGDPPQEFNVTVLSSTAVLLTWCEPSIKNGIITLYTVTYNISEDESYSAVVYNDTTCRNYTAENLNEDTLYTFYLHASTRIGPGPAVSSTVRTDESQPHSPPTDVTYTDVGTRTVTISWNPPVFEDQNGVILYYQLIILQSQFDINNFIINTSSLIYSGTDLEEYNDYTFMVAAATGVGLGPFSTPQSFMTSEAVPSAAPQSPKGLALNPTLITLQWSPPPPIDVNGVLGHYVVEVTETDTGRAWSFLSLGPSLMLGSLHPYYNYSARVAAYTIGLGPFTELFYVQTNQSSPSDSPTKPEIAAFSSTSVTLMWRPLSVEETNGVITQYTISVTESDTESVSIVSTNSPYPNATLQSLHPFYTYAFKVRAETVAGPGPYSMESLIQLEEAAPSGPPLDITGEAESSSAISLSWDLPEPENRNGIIRQYSVNVTELQTGNVLLFSSVQTYIVISALHPAYAYACTVAAVSVAVGPASQTVTITTEEAAPSSAPLNLSATVVSSILVRFAWEPPIAEDTNGVLVNYILYLTPIQANGVTFQLNSNSTSAAYYAFEPYTGYTVVIAAETAVGAGPLSQTVTFTTLEAAPSSAPGAVVLEAVDSRTLYISWIAPPQNDHNGIIRSYYISAIELETGWSLSVTSATTSVTIPSLHPYYTYLCAVAAVTVNEGPYSVNTSLRLPEDVPTSSVELLMVINITSSAALLSWLPPSVGDQNGIIVNFGVNVTTVPTGETVQHFTGNTELQLESLRPHTDYRVVTAAYTEVGKGPYSTTLPFQTLEDAPSAPPQNVCVSVVDSHTVYISWDPPLFDEHNGVIREYRITITEVDTGATLLETSSVLSATVTSLHPFYTYIFAISPFTVNYGPASDAVNVTMPQDVPASAPMNILATAISPYIIFLTWEPLKPEDHNGVLTGYIINATVVNTGEMFSISTEATNYSLDTLSPHTTYAFNIAATTAVGNGPSSHEATAITHEDGPTSGPTNVTIVLVTATSIHLSWDPPPENTHQGIIRGYRLNVTELATDTKISEFTQVTEIVLASLHPFYIYEILIIAVTVEEGSNYTTVLVATDEAAPSVPPGDLVVTATGSRSIALTWQALQEEDRNGFIQRYIIRVTANDSDEVVEMYSTMLEATVSNLHPFTTYLCVVAAETIEIGPFSDLEAVTTPEDAPSTPPGNVVVVALNSTSLLLTWEHPLLQNRNGIIRRYAVNVTETETDARMALYADDTELILSGLHPSYSYVCAVAAETVLIGPWSEGVTVILHEDAPSSPPGNLSASEVQPTSFLLQWNAPPAGDQNGIIQQYTINIWELDTGRILDYSTTNTEFLVQYVHPFYIYNCSVAAVTVETGLFSNPVTVITLTAKPSAAPEGFAVVALSSSSAYLTWNLPSLEHQNGDITGFTINVTDTETQQYDQFFTQSTNITILTLDPFTVYSFTIAALTSAGTGPYGGIVNIKTPEDAPSAPPSDVMYRNRTSASVTLSWYPPSPETHNGVIRSYLVNVTEEESGESFLLRPTQTEITVSQLHPYYNYSFEVSATTILAGPFSVPLTVETLEDVPSGPPLSLSAAASDSKTIVVSWNPPAPYEQNGVIDYYILKVAETETRLEFTLTPNATIQVVYNLHPYYTYQLSVAAVTIGQGPFSTEYTITTPEDAPSGPPLNLTLEALSPYAVFVTWLPPLPKEQNGVLKLYNITVQEVNSGAETRYWRGAEHTQMMISLLHPYYDYEVSIAATTVQTGVFTDPSSVRTLAAAPASAPLEVSVSVLNSTSILAQWRPPEEQHQNGVIEHYIITIAQVMGNKTFLVDSTELVASSLHPSYSYWLSVAAVTVDTGPFSEAVPFTLPEDVPSGSPQNLKVTTLSSSMVGLLWEPPVTSDHNGNLTGYFITVMAEGDTAPNDVLVQASVLRYTLEGLKPFTNYSVTVAVSTSVGIGPPSFLWIATLEDSPSAPPLNVAALAVSSTTITVSWQPPPLEEQNGIIRAYSVSVYDSERDIWRNVSTNASVTVVTVAVVPFSTYSVSVAAVTVETGVRSQQIAVITPEDIPSGSPLNLRANNVTSRDLILLWDPPAPDDRNGVIQYYDVELSEIQSGQTGQQSSNSASLKFTGLHPYYNYSFIVRAVTIGPGPFSDAFSVQTQEEAPSIAPANFSGIPVNSTHILLSWEQPAEDQINGRIRSYLISVAEIETATQLTLEAGSTQVYTIGPLHPYYQYECSVTAVTTSEGPYTDILIIRTDEDAPSGPPRNVFVNAINSSAIIVTWEPPFLEVQNGVIGSYQVSIAEENMAESSFAVQDTSITISGLHPFYMYDVTVAAVTNGVGPKSFEVRITMPESVPSGPPQDLEGTALSANGIEITWTAPKPEDQNGILKNYFITVTEAETGTIIEFENDPIELFLIVNSLHPYYTYQCSVVAATVVGAGPAMEVTVVTHEQVPTQAPVNINVSAVGVTSAEVRWNSPPPEHHNGVIRAYAVIMIELETGSVVQTETEDTTMLFNGLHPFNTYRFVIAARTIGLGPFSAPITFQMPEATPSAPVQEVTVSVESPSAVKVSWLPPNPQTWNGLIVNYTVTYKLLGPVDTNLSNSTVGVDFALALPSPGLIPANSLDPRVASLPIRTETVIVDNLHEYHVYGFAVYLANSAGRSELSNPILQELPATEPSGAPTGIQVQILSSTSVEILWMPPDFLEQNGVITEYQILLTVVATGRVQQYTVPSIESSIHFEDLRKYGQYNLKIAAMSDYGIGPFSMLIEFRTLQDIPGPPKNVSTELVNATSVLLTWLPPVEPNGEISEYEVFFAGYEDYNENKTQVPEDGPYRLSVTDFDSEPLGVLFTELVIGQTYEFKVRAKTAIGYGDYSEDSAVIQIPEKIPASAGGKQSDNDTTVIAVIAVPSVLLLVVIVVIALLIFRWYLSNKRKKSYAVTEAQGSQNSQNYELADWVFTNPKAEEAEAESDAQAEAEIEGEAKAIAEEY